MKKRILSIVLCLCMMLGLLPTMALAEDTPPTVAICGTTLVSGKYYTAGAADTVTQSDTAPAGPYLAYTTGTLTVHGDVSIENSTENGISVTGAVTIDTGSESDSLTVTNSGNGNPSLSLSGGTVTFTGSGDLTLKGDFTPVYQFDGVNHLLTDSFAGDITISNTDESKSDSNRAIELTNAGSSVQLETTGALNLSTKSPAMVVVADNSSVTLQGNTVSLTNDGTRRLVEAGEISITSTSKTADLTLTGETVYNTLLSATKYVNSTGNITLSSGRDLTVQNASAVDGAIFAGGSVTATSAGKLTIASASYADTIAANKGNITLQGDTVSLTNSSTGCLAYAAAGDISITSTSETADLTLTGSPSASLFPANSGNGTVTLSCGGDLTINNKDGSNSSKLIDGRLTIKKAKNVNISGACGSAMIRGDLNISGVTAR